MRRALLLSFAVACARPVPPVALPAPPPAVFAPSPAASLDAEAAELWARRAEPGAAREAETLYARAAALEATGERQVALAQARHFRATQVDPGPEAQAAFKACGAAGDAALRLAAPHVELALQHGVPAATALAALPLEAAAALYWRALCELDWARGEGPTTFLSDRAELVAAFERVHALAPALDDAGPARALGTLYGAAPPYAGGDLTRAQQLFEEAVAAAPGRPATRIAYARTVGVKRQDRALFDAQLAAAAQAPSSPEADLEKPRAAALAAEARVLFADQR